MEPYLLTKNKLPGRRASSTGRASFATSFSRGDSSDGALSSDEE